jgi:hypothetical protein
MSYDSIGWELEPGAARDVGVGADGSVWVVGTGVVPGGFGIWRWGGADWISEPGGATNISVGRDGLPWVVNSNQQNYRRRWN